MTCTQCNGTGSLSRDLHGHLDCTHCGIATERAMVEHWTRQSTASVGAVDAWLIYQHGKVASSQPLIDALLWAQKFIQGSGHHTPEIDAALAAAGQQ